METNIDTPDNEGKSGENVVKEASTSPISEKKKVDTVDKKEISQTSKERVGTDTLNTVDKSRSTPITNLSNKLPE